MHTEFFLKKYLQIILCNGHSKEGLAKYSLLCWLMFVEFLGRVTDMGFKELL